MIEVYGIVISVTLLSGIVLYVNKKVDDINKNLETTINSIRSDISEIKTDIRWIKKIITER